MKILKSQGSLESIVILTFNVYIQIINILNMKYYVFAIYLIMLDIKFINLNIQSI